MTKKTLSIIAIICFAVALILFFIPINEWSLMWLWFTEEGKLARGLASAFGGGMPGEVVVRVVFFVISLIGGIGSLIWKRNAEE